MCLLLTGSSGWLGRHLAPLLARAGHEVILSAPPPFTRKEVGSALPFGHQPSYVSPLVRMREQGR